ncbi:MAG: O-antigen ligase family protein [Anaerolineae bacterium]|nr:O-antigen ligase family protein [Anaerolineae bacterium]
MAQMQAIQNLPQTNDDPAFEIKPMNRTTNWFVSDRRRMALLTGVLIGVGAGLLGLLIAVGTPILGAAVLFGVGIGLYVLTDLRWGLYATVGVMALLPFATLPVRVAVTPTLLDVALGGFLLVYIVQWMQRRRSGLRLIPASALVLLFVLFTLFSFVAGLGHAQLTTNVLRKFVELLLSILLVIVLIDVLRDTKMLRRLTLVLILAGALQAIVGIGLYALNDETAERLLNTLGRVGYPVGGVIRYIEDDPSQGERAIGTWVDPNAYGGFLMMVGAVAGAQVLARKPVTGKRWIAFALFGLIGVALLLTQSRGAFVALAAGGAFIALMRYRWLLVVGAIGVALLFLTPFMQSYVDRLLEGFAGEDLATQMRFGEYKDAFILIGRYPLIGVGFAGSPDRDIYLGVSNMYLKIAGATGLVGLSLFSLIMLEVFRYGLRRWRQLSANPLLDNLWLGFTAGIIGVLVNGVVDHYYFNIEFHAAETMFWVLIALSLAAARLSTSEIDTA